jgi:surface antigen
MRTAVLTGILACTLVLVTQSQQAGALALEKLENTPNDQSVELLLAVVNDKSQEAKNENSDEEDEPEKHVIEKNESLSDVAEKHKTTWKRIYDKNTSIDNPDIVEPGEVVVIPQPDEDLEPRELPKVDFAELKTVSKSTNQPSSVVKSTTATTVSASPAATRGSSTGNLYTAGNCTWYVKSLRPDLPNNLGNAYSWVSRASAQGMATGSTPRVGAVAQRNNHVAYVTGVNGDGTINITDMNYRALYQVTNRTVPANQWSFIY